MPRRNGVQRATYEKKIAWLSGEWGLKVATEKFGAELIAQMPTYAHGPRKGLPKGALTFVKCTEGGWMRIQPTDRGGVIRPGTYDWALTLTPYNSAGRDHGRVAEWSWNKGNPTVRQLQTPAEAEAMAKTYGDNPRYG